MTKKRYREEGSTKSSSVWKGFVITMLGTLVGAGLGTYGSYYVQHENGVREQKMEVISLCTAAVNELERELVRWNNIGRELVSLGAVSPASDNSSWRRVNLGMLDNLNASDIGFLSAHNPTDPRFVNLLLETPVSVRVLPTVQEIAELYSNLQFSRSIVLNRDMKAGVRTFAYFEYLFASDALDKILNADADYLNNGNYSEQNKTDHVQKTHSIWAEYLNRRERAGLGGVGPASQIRMIPGSGW